MTRIIGMTILTMACTVALLEAQGRPRSEPNDPGAVEKRIAPAKNDSAPPEKQPAPAAPPSGEKPEEVVKRLNENFEKSEERLGAKDPGEETQKKQDQIVKDLNELIKQQQQNNSGSGGSSSSSSKNSSSNQGGAQKNQDANKQGKRGGKDQKGEDQTGKKESDAKSQSAKHQGKDSKGGSGAGTNNDEPKKSKTTDAVGRGIWGHVREKQRQEMEIYGKQRFLPKYEDLLRQYYRTISESDRSNGD